MKKVAAFLSIFIFVLILGYAQPIVLKETKNSTGAHQTNDGQSVYNSIPYKKIETAGFATYIGADFNEFKDEFGEPTHTFLTSAGYEWNQYGNNNKNYFQVAVKNDKIIEILSFGSNLELIAPFKTNMTLKDLTKKMTLYSNFSFDFDGETFEFELSEKDIELLPLIAFSNDSFVMCHFSPLTSELVALRYVDKSVLLELMPYSLSTGNDLPFIPEETNDWENINKSNNEQATKMLSLMEDDNNFYAKKFDQELSDVSGLFINELRLSPTTVFSDETRLQSWNFSQSVKSINQPFYLDKKEFKQLIKVSHFSSNKTLNGLVLSPSPDISWTLLKLLREEKFMFSEDASQKYNYGFNSNQDIVTIIELPKKASFSINYEESSSQ